MFNVFAVFFLCVFAGHLNFEVWVLGLAIWDPLEAGHQCLCFFLFCLFFFTYSVHYLVED